MNAQTVGDVRTLVTRRVGLKRKVAVLGSDALLVQGLQTNGCEVLVDPASLTEISAFSPQVVVAFDGFALEDGRSAFTMLAQAAPAAEVVFSFAHAGSATALLAGLLGETPPRAFAESEVTRWLSSAGYVVSSRDIVVVPHVATHLSADTESALRQLFEQLNPDAAADRLLVVAKRGAAPTAAERTSGLLSVVISSGPDRAPLEGTLASLLGQQQRPLELVLSSGFTLAQTDALLAKARTRAGLTCVTVDCASSDWATRCNAGQYLAFIEAGDLLTPFHYSTLLSQLSQGTRAWALAAAQSQLPTVFSVSGWLQAGAVQRQSSVVDRDRTATLPLTFAENLEGAEALRFARLAALFEPSWAAPAVTIETLASPTSSGLEAIAHAMRTRPLRMLTTLSEVLKSPTPPRLRDLVSARMKSFSKRR